MLSCPGSSREEIKESVTSGVQHLVSNTQREVLSLKDELIAECIPSCSGDKFGAVWETAKNSFYVPYLPAFHRPGWLLRYAVGPFDDTWRGNFFADVWAGITVAMLLIPQALSYATLANLPPINGLYCAILPSFFYTFFGSSLQLAVGPVAIVSLLMGQLVSLYGVTPGSPESVDFAGEVCLAMGMILTVLSIINAGNFIRYISFPVMSGFTSAAACLIGLNQLKNIFGFTASYFPQTGDGLMKENWEVMHWLVENYYSVAGAPTAAPVKMPSLAPTIIPTVSIDVTPPITEAQKASAIKKYLAWKGVGKSVLNPYSIAICFGLFVTLAVINMIKKRFKATPERKKNRCFQIWIMLANIAPFFAIIVGAGIAHDIKMNDNFDNYNYTWTVKDTKGGSWSILDDDPVNSAHSYYAASLKCVGIVPSGVNIIHTPSMSYPFSKLVVDVLPLALIAFMESYSVARKMASIRNELHILNASQELWAVGVANLLGSVSSAYPVAGSFSRSSLNLASGARTPLSKVTTLFVILLTLGVLTDTFGFIPQSALAAVIMASISSLIDIRDFWNTWKYSKKDFFIMTLTAAFTFAFDTQWGILGGILASLFVYLGEVAFSQQAAPKKLFLNPSDNDGIEVVVIESDLVFLTSARIKDFLTSLVTMQPKPLDPESSRSEFLYNSVASRLDRLLVPQLLKSINAELPKAIVVDFRAVHLVDITGLQALQEFMQDARSKGVLVTVINTTAEVTAVLVKFGIKSDSAKFAELEKYTDLSNLAVMQQAYEPVTENVDDDAGKSGKSTKRPSMRTTQETAFAGELDVEEGALVREARIGSSLDEWDTQNGGRVRRTAAGSKAGADAPLDAAVVALAEADEASAVDGNAGAEMRSIELSSAALKAV